MTCLMWSECRSCEVTQTFAKSTMTLKPFQVTVYSTYCIKRCEGEAHKCIMWMSKECACVCVKVATCTSWFDSDTSHVHVCTCVMCKYIIICMHVFETATTEQIRTSVNRLCVCMCVCAEPRVGVRRLNAIKHVVLTSVLCLLIPHYGANKPAWTLCHSQSR